jgi:hypothetical protein
MRDQFMTELRIHHDRASHSIQLRLPLVISKNSFIVNVHPFCVIQPVEIYKFTQIYLVCNLHNVHFSFMPFHPP